MFEAVETCRPGRADRGPRGMAATTAGAVTRIGKLELRVPAPGGAVLDGAL